jgi:hypothetical protein
MIFNKKRQEVSPEESRLEEKIKREMQYKDFQKNIDKTVKEASQKLEQYKKMAVEAKNRGNNQQLATALKYMKFVQFNIDRAQNLKFQLDMAFMNTNFSTTMKDFVTSLSSFAEGMKLEGVTAGEMAKSFSKFSLESQRFTSQIERFDSFMEDTETIFDELMPNVAEVNDSEIDEMLSSFSSSGQSQSIDKIDELLKDLKG